jgi:hypothetical protein
MRYVSPKPRHTSFRKGRAIVGAAQGGSGSEIPDMELIHPGVSDLDRETPFGNSTGILGVVGAHLLRAASANADGAAAPNAWRRPLRRPIRASEDRGRPRGEARPDMRAGPAGTTACVTSSRPAPALRDDSCVVQGLVPRRASTVKSTRPADRSAPRGSAVSRLSGSTRSERRGVSLAPCPSLSRSPPMTFRSRRSR